MSIEKKTALSDEAAEAASGGSWCALEDLFKGKKPEKQTKAVVCSRCGKTLAEDAHYRLLNGKPLCDPCFSAGIRV